MKRNVLILFRRTMLAVGLLTAGCAISQVRIETEPTGAAIYWDDLYIGQSPLVYRPPLDSRTELDEIHLIEAVMDGYMTGLGYLAERGQGGGLQSDAITLRLHEAPEWYARPPAVSEPSPPARTAEDPLTLAEAHEQIRRVACDLRVVRVRDGRVMAAVSGVAGPERLIILVEDFVKELNAGLPADVQGQVTVLRVRNRRLTPAGDQLAEELTTLLRQELGHNGRLKPVATLDLREMIEPRMRDHSKVVTHPDVRKMLRQAPYIIQGGLAEIRDPRQRGAVVDYYNEERNVSPPAADGPQIIPASPDVSDEN